MMFSYGRVQYVVWPVCFHIERTPAMYTQMDEFKRDFKLIFRHNRNIFFIHSTTNNIDPLYTLWYVQKNHVQQSDPKPTIHNPY